MAVQGPGPLLIRKARPNERAALEALQRRASLANDGDREALLANPDAIALPDWQIANGHVHVAELGGRIAGFSAALPREGGAVELDGLFVAPELWRRGVGRALIDHAVEQARAAGARTMQVTGNRQAEAFYRACGFETVGVVTTRFGDGLRMEKKL